MTARSSKRCWTRPIRRSPSPPKAYEGQKVHQQIRDEGALPAFPSRDNATKEAYCLRRIYRRHHKIENYFCRIKDWRRMAPPLRQTRPKLPCRRSPRRCSLRHQIVSPYPKAVPGSFFAVFDSCARTRCTTASARGRWFPRQCMNLRRAEPHESQCPPRANRSAASWRGIYRGRRPLKRGLAPGDPARDDYGNGTI